MSSISDLVKDWGGFEKFIAKLHETGDVTVEHNVTLTGRSGAPRQIDVLVRHKQGLYEHLVVVECKYWKSTVKRQQVDALSKTVEEIGASRGVIFSTKGFQSGAIMQAPHDNIDLFKVRDLTAEEWGSPGKTFDMFLQVNSIAIGNISFHNTFSHRPLKQSNCHLDLHLGDAKTSTLIIGEGKLDKTLEEMIERVAVESAHKSYTSTPVRFGNDFEGEMCYRVNVDVHPTTPIRIEINSDTIFIPRITFDIGVKISQTRILVDRTSNLKFALAIEDCVRRTVTAASRHISNNTTKLTAIQVAVPKVPEDVYKNGSLMTVWVNGFIPFDDFADLELGQIVIK